MTLEHLDAALDFFYKNIGSSQVIDHSRLYNHLDELFRDERFYTSVILAKLSKDGFLVTERTNFDKRDEFLSRNYDYYFLSYEGIQFYNLGGYKNEQNRIIAERDFEKKKMELELKHIQSGLDTNASVIETNSSVQKTTKKQERLVLVSILVAAASTLFAFGSVWVAYNDTTSTELQHLSTQYQKQLQVSMQIQQHLRGIDSSLRTIAKQAYQRDSLPQQQR